ncbi:MAG TPA: right-handed parallel beta-helix repeat-containing protein [Usitatibacter sp.]|jgi:hypothetical protein|nr:right-handed parallel beta-helix repeat-containing protein [Usitatibacter sp.]
MKGTVSRFIVPAVAGLVVSVGAYAQAFRTYVASYGSAANPCTVSQPCRLVSDALPATLDGGEIWILDSANFNSGTLNINKSVTIMAIPGQMGSIVAAAGGPAITIATAFVNVRLRNLLIVDNANNHGTDGIDVAANVSLTVDDCVMRVQGDAVVANGSNATALVMNSRILGANYGVHAKGGASVEVVRTDFANVFNYGVYVDASTAATSTIATIRDSSFSKVYSGAVLWSQVAGADGRLSMTGSSVSSATWGIYVRQDAGTAVATAGGNTFGALTYGMVQASGTMESFGNNMSRAPNFGVITTVGQN